MKYITFLYECPCWTSIRGHSRAGKCYYLGAGSLY